jgi:type 1 glutamine amidotransferase
MIGNPARVGSMSKKRNTMHKFPLGNVRRDVFAAMLCAILVAAADGRAAEPPDKRAAGDPQSQAKRVLIVTGEDYKGHHWQATAPLLKILIRKDRRLAVDVIEDLSFLRTPRLHEYDVVVAHFKNYDPEIPGRAGHDNLAKFVEQGGGLVVVHFACGAFQEFRDDFVKLVGRVWNPEFRGHDRYGEFAVEPTAADHPITHGLGAFKTTDELYTCLDGDTPITVLARARSVVDKKYYPMAFVLDYGKGRVFHTPLGHDVAALGNASTAELLRRGTAWASGLEVQPGKGGPDVLSGPGKVSTSQ